MQTMRKPEGVPLESDMSKCTVAGRPILCILSRRTTTAGARRRTTPAISTATSAGSVVGRARSRTGGSLQLTPPTVSVVRSIAPAVGPCCFCLEGPLLLSAPHGKEVWREGNWAWVTGISGKRLHRRELYTTELVVRLVDSPPLKSNSSFIVWNARVMKDSREGLDPNYLHSKEMKSSQWHSALHEFRNKFRGDPTGCIHFDIHGKKDRSGPTIDIGLEVLFYLNYILNYGWRENKTKQKQALRHFAPSLYNKVRAVVNERLSAVLQAVPSVKGGKRFGLTFPGPSERDNGFWQRTADGTLQRPPQSPSTLVSQSAGMGVLGVQIEVRDVNY